MSELKPCPFCRSSNIVFDYYEISGPQELGTIVVCNSCGSSAKPEVWNTRPIEAALRARISELESATRWIPVEKWLPEKEYSDVGDEVIVLLAYPYSRVATMKFGNDEFYSGGFGACVVYWTQYVTHWQPLPQPPEVQE